MIPLEKEDTSNKPFNKENPFLNKQRGDIGPVEGVIPLGGRQPAENTPSLGSYAPGSGGAGPSYNGHPPGSPGTRIPSDYGDVKGGNYPGEITPQGGNNDEPYPTARTPDPARCKLGVFGCGTSGSGSYSAVKGVKHPGGVYGNVGAGSGSPESVNSGPGLAGRPGAGPDSFASAGRPGVPPRGNLAGPFGGAGAGAYAGSFSSASSSSFGGAKSLSFSSTGGSYPAQVFQIK